MVAAALADGTADRDCVFEVFARRLPDGRRYGVVAGTGRLLEALPHFRFGDDELDVAARAGRRPTSAARLAGRLPVRRRHRRLPRGRAVLPRLADPDRPRAVRRGRAARDAGPVGAQPRLRDRLGRRAHGRRRRRPARASRWARGAPTRRPRSPPPGPRTSPGSRPRPTSRPAGATASRRAAPARTPSRCCTTTRRRRSGRRWPPSAPARRCSSTPTTSTRASGPRSRSPARSSGGIRIDSGDLPRSPATPASCSTRSARRGPGSSSPATSTSTRSPGWWPRRSTATASAPRWSPARARRPRAWSTSSSQRDGVPGGEEVRGQGLGRRPQARRPPARRGRARRWPRWSAARRSPPRDGDRRPRRPAGARRRGRARR